MKRLLSTCLCVCLLATLFVPSYPTVSAQTGMFLHSASDIENLYYRYENIAAMFEGNAAAVAEGTADKKIDGLFGVDNSIAYWKYAHSQEKNSKLDWYVSVAEFLLNQKKDVAFYCNVLLTITSMLELNIADQIEQQSEFDRLKTSKDYLWDLADVTVSGVGVFFNNKIASIASSVLDAKQLVAENVEETKYFQAITQNYAAVDSFLEAVINHSDNPDLCKAAEELRSNYVLLFKERLRYVCEVGANTVSYTLKFYREHFSPSLLKALPNYTSDKTLLLLFNSGTSLWSAGKSVYDAYRFCADFAILVGDTTIGFSNIIRRHQEMTVLADIADAIVKAYGTVSVSITNDSQTLYSNVRRKCDYYKMLLTVHMRGEYTMHSLVANDAGLLSIFETLAFGTYNDIWYEKQTDNIEKYYQMVVDVFGGLCEPLTVIDIDFQLYDGFIKPVNQLDTVPADFIGIYTFDDFKKIADAYPYGTNENLTDTTKSIITANYILMNDIECPDNYKTVSVFGGFLDGNGYTIRNITRPLFASYDGMTVQNLGLEANMNITEDMAAPLNGTLACNYNDSLLKDRSGGSVDNCYVTGHIRINKKLSEFGGMIGSADTYPAYEDRTTISNCYNAATISMASESNCVLGGLVGNCGIFTNCYNAGTLTVSNTDPNDHSSAKIGGIVGYTTSNMFDCLNSGDITYTAIGSVTTAIGGLIGSRGSNLYKEDNVIENCVNKGCITVDTKEIFDPFEYNDDDLFHSVLLTGGIVGATTSPDSLTIRQCRNLGDVSGETHTGGIIGKGGYSGVIQNIVDCYNAGTVNGNIYVGGIGGILKRSYISRCHNNGFIAGGSHTDALVSELSDADNLDDDAIADCYYLDNGVYCLYSEAKMLTAEQMASKDSFSNFDFITVWKLNSDDLYPVLL